VTISGFVYWLEVLAPYAQAGYLTGALFPEAVYLTNGTDVVRLPRGGWAAPSLATSTESDEGALSAEEVKTLHALMRVDVTDVSSSMIEFLT
jgi:hypothetical protein